VIEVMNVKLYFLAELNEPKPCFYGYISALLQLECRHVTVSLIICSQFRRHKIKMHSGDLRKKQLNMTTESNSAGTGRCK